MRLLMRRVIWKGWHHRLLTSYSPGQELSVDEGMVKYKGQAGGKVCMPKKPVKWDSTFGAAPVLAVAISARFRYTRAGLY